MNARYCTVPGCKERIPAGIPGARCPVHGKTNARLYDAKHRKLRKVVLAQQPVCARCQQEWATDMHHKVPIATAPGMRLVRTNVVGLCARCHAEVETERRAIGGGE